MYFIKRFEETKDITLNHTLKKERHQYDRNKTVSIIEGMHYIEN